MQQFLNKIIFKLENYKISFLNFILTLLSIAFIRSFCEGICERKRVIGHILTDNHYDSLRHNFNFWSLEWLAMFATLVLIFYIFTRENILKISKILLIFYPIIILPVILDYFIYFPNGSEITYFYTIREYLNGLLNFFIFNKEIPKASLGVRIEVFLAVILSFFYVYLKKSNFFSAFICALCVYFISISSMAFPVFILLPLLPFLTNPDNFIFNFFSSATFPFDSESKVAIFIIFYLLLILLLLFIIYNKNLVKNFLFKTINCHAVCFNIFLFLFGFFFAAKQHFFHTKINIFISPFTGFYVLAGIFLVFFISLIFLLFAPDTNNIFKKLFKNNFNPFFYILFLLTFFLSISISYPAFLISVFILAIFYILFKTPFNLFRFFIIKVILYSILSCIFILLGFSLINGIYAPQKISFSLTAILFLFFISLHSLINTKNKILDKVFLFLIIFSYLIACIIWFDNKLIFLSAIFCCILTLISFLIKKKFMSYYIFILFLFFIVVFI